MAKIHNLGFPRIGPKRELKFALEDFWNSHIEESELRERVKNIQSNSLSAQANLDYVPVGDFSLYDHVLDTSFMVGNVPQRCLEISDNELFRYFSAARGKGKNDSCCGTDAGEMTKWFNTNYHYIVPELNADTVFSLHEERLVEQIKEARSQGYDVKPVILGPVTYLWLARATDNSDRLDYLHDLLAVYKQLLEHLGKLGIEWVQVDEPALIQTLPPAWKIAYLYAYECLRNQGVRVLLTTYFGPLKENLSWVSELPVDGFHIDVTQNTAEAELLSKQLTATQVLSVGVIDGRNVWKAPLNRIYHWLVTLHQQLDNRLWLAPSCSLLHVPVDVENEQKLPESIKDKLSFAVQKLDELTVLKQALHTGDVSQLGEDRNSVFGGVPEVSANNVLVNSSDGRLLSRSASFDVRYSQQVSALKLPLLPTTTIGSFPQTSDIRKVRQQYRANKISELEYKRFIQAQIKLCIETQERLGLDVLVHGEAERNDMVEYFGELLEGVAVTQFGWVQSYGSRCVKPPLIHDDVRRGAPMTTSWIAYAQSLTEKPVKGMLTGPVTILNWSFVRDDLARADVAQQIAFAIRDEVTDLEAQGTHIIQVDEAALREGLPLREEDKETYLRWAVNAFRLSTSGVKNHTQIHTHMCYSEFSDIRDAIVAMDADVITIEAARSQHTVLSSFSKGGYPSAIGPGVYDIHSPVCPSPETLSDLIHYMVNHFDVSKLWINPDCGLKTRTWPQVTDALTVMVNETTKARKNLCVTA